jgi:hypothetical protein
MIVSLGMFRKRRLFVHLQIEKDIRCDTFLYYLTPTYATLEHRFSQRHRLNYSQDFFKNRLIFQ